MTSRSSFVRAHGRSQGLALASAGLTAFVCMVLLVLASTPLTALAGLMLGLCVSATLGMLSAGRPRLLPTLTAYPAILILCVAAAQLFLLYGLDHGHELRTDALVLTAWLVVAAAFNAMDRLAFDGHYRDAARQSATASVILFFVAMAIWTYGAAFFDGPSPGFPYEQAYVLSAQLAAVCFFTGVLVAPAVLVLRGRAARSRDEEPVSVHETGIRG